MATTTASFARHGSKSPPLNGIKPPTTTNNNTQTTNKPKLKPKTTPVYDDDDDDDDDFVIINQWIKLDLRSNVLLSNCSIDSGTRILIELPLFKIGEPPQISHPGNSLFLYHKFINDIKEKKLQNEILYHKYPLKKLNKNIREHTIKLKKLLKKNNNLSNKSVIKYNNKQWNEIEILLNIFNNYSISLQLLSDPYNLVYDHYKKKRGNGNNCSNVSNDDEKYLNGKPLANDDNAHVINLGKGLYNHASHLMHACNPCCRVNVIDEKGTIEIRTLVDIPTDNIPLTRNFIDDTRGMGVSNTCSTTDDNNFIHLLINDDINLIPCNLRCSLLLKNYYFVCQCPKCQSWDKTRGFLCCNASNSNGCQGILWSTPPYLTYKCQKCFRLINKNKLKNVLNKEKLFRSRLKGIEELINYKFKIDINKILYPLLNECSKYLASNHWIIIRLLWICFEYKLSNINSEFESIEKSLIYLKRHIELCEEINDYNLNPSIIMANKYELLSDLLPYNEIYKIKSIEKAIKIRILINGNSHSSVKRCLNKLKFYKSKSMNKYNQIVIKKK